MPGATSGEGGGRRQAFLQSVQEQPLGPALIDATPKQSQVTQFIPACNADVRTLGELMPLWTVCPPGRPLTPEPGFAHIESGSVEWEPPYRVRFEFIYLLCKEPRTYTHWAGVPSVM